jgi:ribose/xylose/arabinose/galactoside ABC-type transport system permease subunit
MTDLQPVAPPANGRPSLRSAGDAPSRRGLRELVRSDAVISSATLIGFVVILLGIYGPWLGGEFLNTGDRVFDVYQNVAPLLLSIGIVVALSAGQFDLSAGAMATMSVFLTVGLTGHQNLPLPLVLVIVLVVGVLGGLLNGFLVVGLRINAFIATLGTGAVFTGISELYSGGQTMSFTTNPEATRSALWFNGPHGFGSFQAKPPVVLSWLVVAIVLWCAWSAARLRWIAAARPRRRDLLLGAGAVAVAVILQLLGIPAGLNWTILVLLVAASVVWLVLRQTALGRAIYATGGNPVAARLAGIGVSRLMVGAFVTSGLFASLAGIVLTATQGNAVPGIADGFLLPAYAAAFLSTVIVSAGRFHIWGTVAGGLAVVWVAQGLVIGGLPFTWTDLINGAVLIIAVSLSTTLRRALMAR